MLLFTGSFFNNPHSGGGGSPTYPLDAYSPTGAWSMSRDLLSSWAGNARYTTATGVDSWKDQTGNGRHFNQSTTSLQPSVDTAVGPNNRTGANFDGSDDILINTSNMSSFIANNDAFIVVSCLIDTITTDNSGSIATNQALFGDPGGYTGLVLRSTGPNAWAYNFDGGYKQKEIAITTATPLVLTWRHTGGTLYISKNGGSEASVAAGNTGDLAYKFQLGHTFTTSLDGKIVELATWNSGSTPDATARAAIIADFMSHVGAT
jgi:hypothetical protein